MSSQMKMLLTRIGEGSRVIITGDVNQSDLKEKNGLKDVLMKINDSRIKSSKIKIIELEKDDIERSEIVKLIYEIYESSNLSPDETIKERKLITNVSLDESNISLDESNISLDESIKEKSMNESNLSPDETIKEVSKNEKKNESIKKNSIKENSINEKSMNESNVSPDGTKKERKTCVSGLLAAALVRVRLRNHFLSWVDQKWGASIEWSMAADNPLWQIWVDRLTFLAATDLVASHELEPATQEARFLHKFNGMKAPWENIAQSVSPWRSRAPISSAT